MNHAGSHAAPGNYLPGVDGLRAIAVLSVMAYHLQASWLPGGFVGVDVFFVISGYVVTGSLARHPVHGLGSYLLDFYGRRFRRILPAFLVCALCTTLLVVLFVPNAWLSSAVKDTAMASLLGLSNFALLATNDGYFAPRAELNAFTHTWSLAVEEQFYLVYPLVIYLSLRPGAAKTRRWVPVTFAALMLASLAWAAYLTPRRPDVAYFMLWSRYWELAAGGALFLAAARGAERAVPRWAPDWALASGLALAVATMVLAEPGRFPFPWAVPAVVATLLMIWGLQAAGPSPPLLARLLASRPCRYVGLRSYSLYLWHWPVYTLMRWTNGLESPGAQLLALAATFSAAGLSYAFVEQPALRSRRVGALPRLAVVGGALASVACTWVLARQAWAHQPALSRSIVMQQARDWYATPAERASAALLPARCTVRISHRGVEGGDVQEFAPQDCKPAAPDPGPRLFVLGDSHAGAYRRLLHMWAQATGNPVTLQTKGGCSVASMLAPSRERSAGCQAFERWSVEEVRRRVRPGDIVFLAALRTVRLGGFAGAFDPATVADERDGPRARELRAAATEEADALVRSLRAAGAVVLIDLPKPVFASPHFRCADVFNAGNPVCRGALALSREFFEKHRRPVVEALDAMAAAHPGLLLWDPMEVLCTAMECAAVRDGRPLYFDGDHLSGYANELLFPAFVRALRPADAGPPASRGVP